MSLASGLQDGPRVIDRIAGLRLVTTRPAPDAAPSEPPARVALLRLDSDFLRVIPAEDRPLAETALRLPLLVLQPGAWEGPSIVRGARALLVADGLMSRSVLVSGRSTPELLGPGDVIDGADPAEGPGEDEIHWAVHQPTQVAVLGDRFATAARRWPGLWEVLLHRGTARAGRLASQLATLQLSRVEDRVERTLWQLADRWGRVTPEGVVVPVTLTHEALGRLAGARRPTVSLALGTLAERGSIVRRIDGTWLLVPGRDGGVRD